MDGPTRDAVEVMVGFARVLRGAGVDASPDRVALAVASLSVLEPARRTDVYWAGRLTCCRDPGDFERYDRAFAAYFDGEGAAPLRQSPRPRAAGVVVAAAEPSGDGEEGPAAMTAAAGASSVETLRHRDIRALTAAERRELDRLLSAFRLRGEERPSRRLRPAARGTVDRARTTRELIRVGEVSRLRRQRRATRPRRVVLLVDVSGSMGPYAEALLRFAHAAVRRGDVRTEVFTLGTRLTRVTEELGKRDPEQALAAVSAAVIDWRGGTRLGALLKAFLDEWGQRGMARGAVVVVLSDGWERGDVALLGDQMGRLSRLASRIVWGNPRAGQHGFEPTAAGMAAALPYIDDLVAGHSLAALERLAGVVAGRAREVGSHA